MYVGASACVAPTVQPATVLDQNAPPDPILIDDPETNRSASVNRTAYWAQRLQRPALLVPPREATQDARAESPVQVDDSSEDSSDDEPVSTTNSRFTNAIIDLPPNHAEPLHIQSLGHRPHLGINYDPVAEDRFYAQLYASSSEDEQ